MDAFTTTIVAHSSRYGSSGVVGGGYSYHLDSDTSQGHSHTPETRLHAFMLVFEYIWLASDASPSMAQPLSSKAFKKRRRNFDFDTIATPFLPKKVSFFSRHHSSLLSLAIGIGHLQKRAGGGSMTPADRPTDQEIDERNSQGDATYKRPHSSEYIVKISPGLFFPFPPPHSRWSQFAARTARQMSFPSLLDIPDQKPPAPSFRLAYIFFPFCSDGI